MPKYNHLIAANITLPQQSKALKSWIENCEFEKYESPDYELNHTVGRLRNKLYNFMLPNIDRQVVMKVLHIHERHKWKRQFKSILGYNLRGTDKVTFRCCEKAYSHNLATPEPLAYWEKSYNSIHSRNYFLYQYIDISSPWLDIYKKLREAGDVDSHQKSDLIKQKIINALKSLHRQGIRHGDLMSHNILMPIQDTNKLSNAKVYFVDYDNASFTKIKYPTFIRRFFDIKDLWKLGIGDNSCYDILKLYLGGDYHRWWNIALIFWRWRGFEEVKMSFPDKLKRLKHRLFGL